MSSWIMSIEYSTSSRGIGKAKRGSWVEEEEEEEVEVVVVVVGEKLMSGMALDA